MTHQRIAIGSDHGAIDLKNAIKAYLEGKKIPVIDKGTHDTNSVDYPDISDSITDSILNKESDLGILCCGTGIGISMRANRNKGIRAALVYDTLTAEMAKQHNNANVLCLGGRTTKVETALSLVETWLNTNFEGGRHDRRIEKLDR
jgi:ribose 5-phosphate isomerase B